MQSDFTNVETELRDIESAFATGRMNAFGSASTQDAFVHELKRIAEIETQVFYRTCALLKSSNTNEHNLVTNMYASAQPPPQSQRAGSGGNGTSNTFGDGSFRASASALDSSSMYRSPSANHRNNNNGHSPLPNSTVGSGRSNMHSPGASRPQSRHGRESFMGASYAGFANNNESMSGTGNGGNNGSAAAPHIRQSEWANEDGFSDKAFEDVAAHFDELESQFTSLGEYLREISKHVIRLNDMSEQVNNGTVGAGGLTTNNSVSLNANNQGVSQSFEGGVRRGRNDSVEDEGGNA